MKLKELLETLPNNLEVSIEYDGCKTSSTVNGIKKLGITIEEKEVISIEPKFIHSIGAEFLNIKIDNKDIDEEEDEDFDEYEEESQKDFMMRTGLDTRGIYGY